MMIILLLEQRLAETQFVQHHFVRVTLAVLLQDALANELGGHRRLPRQVVGARDAAAVIDRGIGGRAVALARAVIFQAMTRGDMDEAGGGAVLPGLVPGEEVARAVAER